MFFHLGVSSKDPILRRGYASFIQSGALTAETLVSTEGMAKAVDIPGLLSGTSAPPADSHSSWYVSQFALVERAAHAHA